MTPKKLSRGEQAQNIEKRLQNARERLEKLEQEQQEFLEKREADQKSFIVACVEHGMTTNPEFKRLMLSIIKEKLVSDDDKDLMADYLNKHQAEAVEAPQQVQSMQTEATGEDGGKTAIKKEEASGAKLQAVG